MSASHFRHTLAGALIAAFFLQSFFASLVKSPSSDEPPHIAAGMSYLQEGVFRPNPQHPPLIKELSAISLLLAGFRLPSTPEVKAMFTEEDRVQLEWGVGRSLIAQNGPRVFMLWARLPVIILSTLLALLIYVWGREIIGDIAALGALAIYAFDPNLIAHSAFVTTDMGLAVFVTLFFFLLWRYLRRPGLARLLLCGFAMGLALGAKFSAPFMIAMAVPLLLASPACGRTMGRRAAGSAIALAGMLCVAALTIMAIYFSPSGLWSYWQGLNQVYSDHNPAYLHYMAGRKQPLFYSYFAVAWLLKEPVAIVVLVLSGAVVLIRRRAVPLVDKLFIFLPPAVLFAACTFGAHDIGIRYFIPAFPFLCLAGGVALAALVNRPSVWSRGLAVALCGWMIVAAAGIYPDHLSYFNEAACLIREPREIGFDGGSKCGPLWLDDSNVDWGQGVAQLQAWLKQHPDPRPLRMEYFGSFPPKFYGIPTEPSGIGVYDQVAQPGLYAISSHIVARFDESWLRTIPPKAIVGHAYYIYDITRLQ